MKEIEINPLTHQDYSRSSFNTIKKETKDLTQALTESKEDKIRKLIRDTIRK